MRMRAEEEGEKEEKEKEVSGGKSSSGGRAVVGGEEAVVYKSFGAGGKHFDKKKPHDLAEPTNFASGPHEGEINWLQDGEKS